MNKNELSDKELRNHYSLCIGDDCECCDWSDSERERYEAICNEEYARESKKPEFADPNMESIFNCLKMLNSK